MENFNKKITQEKSIKEYLCSINTYFKLILFLTIGFFVVFFLCLVYRLDLTKKQLIQDSTDAYLQQIEIEPYTEETTYKWLLNNTISDQIVNFTNISFKSNNITYNALETSDILTPSGEFTLFYKVSFNGVDGVKDNVYEDGNWGNSIYKYIEFLEEPTADLLIWLNSNGTRITIEDLTNTTWIFNDNVYNSSSLTKSFNFTSDGNNYTQLNYQNVTASGEPVTIMSYGADNVYDYRSNDSTNYPGFTNNSYKTITITGGTAINDLELIAFLLNNAQQVTETQLDTPVITVSTITDDTTPLYGQIELHWNSISNALYYKIYKNGTLIEILEAVVNNIPVTTYALSDIGDYQIQASVDFQTSSEDSDLSNIITINHVTLEAPILSINVSVLSWNSVNFASAYEIYLNNNLLTTTLGTSYHITSLGDYKVKAINDTKSSSIYVGVFSNIVTSFVELSGTYAFIGSQNYTYNTLPTSDRVLIFNFTSNNQSFTQINWDTTNKTISYNTTQIFSYLYDITQQYFSGFLYTPQDTAQYLFIHLDNAVMSLVDYSVFTSLYRIATEEDYINLGRQEGILDSNKYNMATLIFALADTPILLLKSLLNFNFFGVNLYALCTLLITLMVVFAVIKLIKGGKSKDD